jgi:hypothetical protein
MLSSPHASPINLYALLGSARYWSRCVCEVDQALLKEASHTPVFLLPSAQKFLQGIKATPPVAVLQHCSANPAMQFGVPSSLQRCVPLAVELLISGIKTCHRLEAVSGQSKPHQLQALSRTSDNLREKLFQEVVCTVLPQAYHCERYHHAYNAQQCSDGLSEQDASSDMLLKRGCAPGLCQVLKCTQDQQVQSLLIAMANTAGETRTQNPGPKSKFAQPMYHKFLGYESIGRLCILQVCYVIINTSSSRDNSNS